MSQIVIHPVTLTIISNWELDALNKNQAYWLCSKYTLISENTYLDKSRLNLKINYDWGPIFLFFMPEVWLYLKTEPDKYKININMSSDCAT